MARVSITMSVDGGNSFNDIDLDRLEELWGIYHKRLSHPNMYSLEKFKQEAQAALDLHIKRNNTWFGCRPIHMRDVFILADTELNENIVILPQRATWDAVNFGWDYLQNDRPEIADMEYDSTIRHWASGNLAKFLDTNRGFSRQQTDQQDCFNLILVLQKAMRELTKIIEIKGGRFLKSRNSTNQDYSREPSFLYLVMYCMATPY